MRHPVRSTGGRPPWWSVLLVAGVAMGFYSGTLNDFFLSDDFDLLYRASREPLGRWLVWPDPGRSGWFRPLPEMLWRLNYLAGGLDPFVFRLTNLLLHAGNAVLVAWVAHIAYRKALVATFAGLVFATLPRATGAVSWLAARYDLVATLFVLLTVIMAARMRAARNPAVTLGMACCMVAALMAKEVAYAGPVLLAALASQRLARWSGLGEALVGRRAVLLAGVIAGLCLLVRLWTFQGLGGYGVHGHVSAATLWRPLTLLPAFWPSEDVIARVGSAPWWAIAAGTVAVLASSASIWLLWIVIALMPAANLMHPSLPFFELDRFFYLAGAGWAIGLAAVLRGWNRGRLVDGACVVLVSLALAGGVISTRTRLRAWEAAADLTRRVQQTILREEPGLRDHSALDCSDLPDNIAGAYAYRNGCDHQILLAIPGERVRGLRFVPGIPPDPVSATRSSFAAEFRFSADGRQLIPVRPAGRP